MFGMWIKTGRKTKAVRMGVEIRVRILIYLFPRVIDSLSPWHTIIQLSRGLVVLKPGTRPACFYSFTSLSYHLKPGFSTYLCKKLNSIVRCIRNIVERLSHVFAPAYTDINNSIFVGGD